MTPNTITASVCSLSWINKKSGLPEDDGDGPAMVLPGNKVTQEDDALPFRFLNLLEATITVDRSARARILSADWSLASKIYQNPSFAKIKSEAFETRRAKDVQGDRVRFTQTVGARTVSPEVIGEVAGAALGGLPAGAIIGRKAAHALLGFPPIWTTLSLTVFVDGRWEGGVLCHSLFPSMSYYEIGATSRAAGGMRMPGQRVTSVYTLRGTPYDGVPNLEKWKTDGWGSLYPSPSGTCSGNPWGYKKDDLE